MAKFTPNQSPVVLTDDQRGRLDALTRVGRAPVGKVRAARVLLLADKGRAGGGWTDPAIAAALGLHVNSVAKVRRRFVAEGEEPALNRKVRATPPVPPKVDGRVEAHLVAMCRTDAPDGRARWTLALLAGELAGRGLVTSVSLETVRKALKKNELQPWRKECWCIPERESARFVATMEDVLDLYAQEPAADEPLVCMDEASKQLLRDTAAPIPLAPGRPEREDYQYERRGTQAVFCFFAPNRGWRRVRVTDSRTAVDWAEQVRILLEEDDPQARKVKLVCDNLNTHTVAALYEAFPAEQARALARRLELHHTPVHGSWLNVAEIELSALARQCLDRRIGSADELRAEVAAWVAERNADGCRVVWKFTTANARTRLRHLYPQVKT